MLVNLKKLKTRNKNRIKKGVYVLRGWNKYNFDNYLDRKKVDYFSPYDREYRKNMTFTHYGVCDSYEQILIKHPEIATSNNKFVIGLSKVSRLDQPRYCGWRWHKWGDYIGEHEIKNEYLYDEKHIDYLYVYEIYQIK